MQKEEIRNALVMRAERQKGRGSEEQYVMGSRVQIIGGVYRLGFPVGTIVGATRCYMDVQVPQLKRQVRVRKISSCESSTSNSSLCQVTELGVALSYVETN
jgi:hypothetical protein